MLVAIVDAAVLVEVSASPKRTVFEVEAAVLDSLLAPLPPVSLPPVSVLMSEPFVRVERDVEAAVLAELDFFDFDSLPAIASLLK